MLVALGSDITVGSSSISTGVINITQWGSVQWGGNGAIAQWQSSAALTMTNTAGAATFNNTVNLNGTNNLAGTNNRTGPEIISGNGAWRQVRAHTVSSLGGGIADPRDYDIIYLANGGTSSVGGTLTLDVPAGTVIGIVVRVCLPGFDQVSSGAAGQGGNITIVDGGTTSPLGILNANATQGALPAWVDLLTAENPNNSNAISWIPVASSAIGNDGWAPA
jgi:hypothetical protein